VGLWVVGCGVNVKDFFLYLQKNPNNRGIVAEVSHGIGSMDAIKAYRYAKVCSDR
jgi:hypothetical protein